MPSVEMPVEVQLNRLLRRADWRFLLPNPWPEKTAAAVEGLLRQSILLLGSEVVDFLPGLKGDCDLVVLQNPDQSQLGAAWEALKPGGAFYGEWSLPSAGGPPALRKRLEQAGFSQVATYWAWPLPERASPIFWLPLEAPAALAYFLERRPRSAGLAANLGRAFLRAAWSLVRRIHLIAPFSAVAVKPGTAGQASRPELPGLIRDNWRVDGPGDRPDRYDYLLLTGGLRSINKTVLLVFEYGENQPGLVVKMPRVPESIPFLAREASNLEGVQACWGGRLPGIPRVHFYAACPPFAALGEDALDGEPLQTRLTRENFPQLAHQATDWLVKLANGVLGKPHSNWWERLAAPALAEFESKYGPALSPGEVHRVGDLLSSLGDLPVVCEQRDFSPWNVLAGPNGELVVLDWESAELHGLPCLDLVYFLTFLSFFIDGAMDSKRYLDSFHGQLDPDSFTGRVTQECQQRYVSALGLDPVVITPLRLFAWMTHSLSEYHRLVEDNGGPPDKSYLSQGLFLQLFREELRMLQEQPAQ